MGRSGSLAEGKMMSVAPSCGLQRPRLGLSAFASFAQDCAGDGSTSLLREQREPLGNGRGL